MASSQDRRHSPRALARVRAVWAAWAVASSGAGLLACAEDPAEQGRSAVAEQLAPASGHTGHIGRIHVALQPRPDELEPEPQLQVRGRFVAYRGASEEFVRARANLPVLVWERLVVGQCVASESLFPDAGAPDREYGARELAMIDAGDLRVTLGNREFVTPLALVPDILPWISGVEYVHVDDRIPQLVREPDGTSPLTVALDGSSDGELEGFSIVVAVPPHLTLESARVEANRLTIDWRPPGDTGQIVVLRLQAFGLGEDGLSEPAGEEVTCLVADSGRANLALRPLVSAGLAPEAGLLSVTVSRFDLATVHAGAFGLVDVIVELRAQKTLALAASPPAAVFDSARSLRELQGHLD
jgi:hypothetical protein